jgi:tRNA(Leu) C34 or U34 (ribose-2'-O)-methylase TrmL
MSNDLENPASPPPAVEQETQEGKDLGKPGDVAANMVPRPMEFRGYSCIGIWEPKNPANVGAVLRAAGCFGVDLIGLQGTRYKHRHTFTDTQKAWRHIPMIETNDLYSLLPRGCVGVAVDIVDGATPLPRYVHPERAFYVFGGEDRTLDQRVLGWCRDKIVIPSQFCLNLGAAVNVVLYDRASKQTRNAKVERP